MKMERGCEYAATYLGVHVVNLIDGGVDVARMDRPANLHPTLDGVFLDRKLDIGLFGELFSCPRVSFADEIIHYDEVYVPAETVSHMLA
jgi:hypothetical protein